MTDLERSRRFNASRHVTDQMWLNHHAPMCRLSNARMNMSVAHDLQIQYQAYTMDGYRGIDIKLGLDA